MICPTPSCGRKQPHCICRGCASVRKTMRKQTRARLLVGLGVPATLYVEAVRARARRCSTNCLRDDLFQMRRAARSGAETAGADGCRNRRRRLAPPCSRCSVRLSPTPGRSIILACRVCRCRSVLRATACRKRCNWLAGRSAKICCFASAPLTKQPSADRPQGRSFRSFIRSSPRPAYAHTELRRVRVRRSAQREGGRRGPRHVKQHPCDPLDSRLRGNKRKKCR